MTLIFLAALAAASPSQRGLLPSASPVEFDGHISAIFGGAVVCGWVCNAGLAGGVSGAVALSDRVVFHAVGGVGGVVDYGGTLPLVALGVRGTVVDAPQFRLALFGVGTGRLQLFEQHTGPPRNEDPRLRRFVVGLAPGIALEAGGKRVLFDMSYAPVSIEVVDDRSDPIGYRGSEWATLPWIPDLGVSFIGPRGYGRFRLSPVVPSWSYVREGWWVTLSAAPTLFVNVASIEVGASW